MDSTDETFFDATERATYLEQLLSGQLPAQPRGRQRLNRLMNAAVRGPFLEALLRQSLSTIEDVIQDLAATGDERAVIVLAPLLHGLDEPVVVQAIDALRDLGSPAAQASLTERANFDQRIDVRRAAKAALQQLPDEPTPIFDFEEDQLPLHSAYLTIVDGAGAQMALVARRWNQANTDMIDLATFQVIFDDQQGIQEAFGFSTQPSTEFVDTLDDLEDDGLTPVAVPLATIRAAVVEAYERSLKQRGRTSVSFVAWQSIFVGEDSRPIPPIELPDVNWETDFELYAECHKLLDLDEFGTWYFEPDEISTATDKLNRLQHRRGQPAYEGQLVSLIRQTLTSLVPPNRRQLFQQRLERQAPLLIRIYDDAIHAKRALAAAAGLAETDQVPTSDHPLLQEMLVRSLEDALGRPLIDDDNSA